MDSRSGSVSDSISHTAHSTWRLATIILIVLAIFASMVALAAIGYRSVLAFGPEATGDCLPDCVASGVISHPANFEYRTQPVVGPNVISPMDPAPAGRADSFGSVLPLPQPGSIGQPREVYVWAACLTVAEYSDAKSTYLGYMPDFAPGEGGLTPAGFTYGDTDLTVENLYYQETDSGARRLVLEVDAPLHNELILHAGNMAFPFSVSTTAGLGPNERAWILHSSLGWASGESFLVVLREGFGTPISQAGQLENWPTGDAAYCGSYSEPDFTLPQSATTVWEANWLMGEASNPSTTYLGYMPTMSPGEGGLNDNTFTLEGVDYTVPVLFYQEVGQVRQMVFNSDPRLPDGFIPKIGEYEFPVADSTKLGPTGTSTPGG